MVGLVVEQKVARLVLVTLIKVLLAVKVVGQDWMLLI
jgi:hypothetical protein